MDSELRGEYSWIYPGYFSHSVIPGFQQSKESGSDPKWR